MNRRWMAVAIGTLALVLAGTASATRTRINSMGGGIKQLTVLDDSNIFYLPAELVKYGTWAAIEIGSADVTTGRAGQGTSFQIHYNFSPTAVLAIYGTSQQQTSVNLGATNKFDELNGDGLFQGCDFCNRGDAGGTHKGTVLFGLDLGASRIGFLLSAWADMARQFDADGNTVSNTGPLYIDFGFGFGTAVGAGDIDLGLKIGFGLPTEEDKDGAISESKQIDVGLVFRGSFPFSGPHEIVPFATVDLGFGDSKLTADGSPSFSGLLFNLVAGVDIRLNLGDGITVQPGIGFSGGIYSRTQTLDGVESKDSHSSFTFPFYNLAVDVKVTDWFDIRFGGAQRVFWKWDDHLVDGDQGATTSEAVVQHRISTGVGFNLPAGVALDIEVNTGWWQKGPFFLTGDGGDGAFGVTAALSKDW